MPERVRAAIEYEKRSQQDEPKEGPNDDPYSGDEKYPQHDPRPEPLPLPRARIIVVRQVREAFPHQDHVGALHEKKDQRIERQRKSRHSAFGEPRGGKGMKEMANRLAKLAKANVPVRCCACRSTA